MSGGSASHPLFHAMHRIIPTATSAVSLREVPCLCGFARQSSIGCYGSRTLRRLGSQKQSCGAARGLTALGSQKHHAARPGRWRVSARALVTSISHPPAGRQCLKHRDFQKNGYFCAKTAPKTRLLRLYPACEPRRLAYREVYLTGMHLVSLIRTHTALWPIQRNAKRSNR